MSLRADGAWMPFRSMGTLESWLEEFRQLDYPIAGSIDVISQDGDDGADTGLVVVRLSHASTVVYIEPAHHDAAEWMVTLEQRDAPVSLSAAEVLGLGAELTMVSALCAFLEAKSLRFAGNGDDT